MKPRFALPLCAILGLLILFGIEFLAQPKNPLERVQHEHGITLPSSASEVRCKGDARKFYLPDRGALATFEIDAHDKEQIIDQLELFPVHPRSATDIVPANSRYQPDVSWAKRRGYKTYTCYSKRGDFLTVRLWDLAESKVGVLFYTDWN